jgi:hypothetical protein
MLSSLERPNREPQQAQGSDTTSQTCGNPATAELKARDINIILSCNTLPTARVLWLCGPSTHYYHEKLLYPPILVPPTYTG